MPIRIISTIFSVKSPTKELVTYRPTSSKAGFLGRLSPFAAYNFMDRNNTILIAVLRGYTLAQVAIVFNLTGERIRQLSCKTAQKYRKELGNSYGRLSGIKELRKYKNRLISIITSRFT
jgi:hypothetical protein